MLKYDLKSDSNSLCPAFDCLQPHNPYPTTAERNYPPVEGKSLARLEVGRPNAGFGAQDCITTSGLYQQVGSNLGVISLVKLFECCWIFDLSILSNGDFSELANQPENDLAIGLR